MREPHLKWFPHKARTHFNTVLKVLRTYYYFRKKYFYKAPEMELWSLRSTL